MIREEKRMNLMSGRRGKRLIPAAMVISIAAQIMMPMGLPTASAEPLKLDSGSRLQADDAMPLRPAAPAPGIPKTAPQGKNAGRDTTVYAMQQMDEEAEA